MSRSTSADLTQVMNQTETLSITAQDQHRFDAHALSASAANAPVLIFLAALGTPSRVYRRFGQEMARHGVHVILPDWRGIESSSLRASRKVDFGYRHLLEIDLPAIISSVKSTFPGCPIWLGGHSLGGQLGVLGAAAYPSEVNGLVLVASGSVHLPCYSPQLRIGIRLLTLLSGLTGAVLGYFPGARIGFGGREARTLMHDWSHVAHTGNYYPKGSHHHYENALRELTLPTLALNFEADAWSPARAAGALLGKLENAQRQQWHWGKSETGGIDLDHFSWTKHAPLIVPALSQHIIDQTRQLAPT